MERKEIEGLHWLEFEIFADFPQLKAAVLLRHGGFSTGPYATLNLNEHVGDEAKHVAANLKKVSAILDLPTLIWGKQVHGAHIEEVPPTQPCDGLVCSKPNVGLLIHHADCQAAIFYDPVQQALAAVHCGWRGNVQNIYAATVRKMGQRYGSKPENLFVAISPSLGPDHGEFIHYRQEFPEPFWQFQVKPSYFDLWAISEWQLKQCGLLPHHIQIARICTYTHSEDYFSYRRAKIRGGNATVAMLKG